MRNKGIPFFGIFVLVLFFSFTGCKKNDAQSGKEVKLTFFNTTAEINSQLSDLFDVYHQSHPNVTITLIPTPIGDQQIQQFQSLLASKNPATIANLDSGTIFLYKDKFLDLTSEEPFFKNIANDGIIESALHEGKLLGIPYTVQGYGLLYNTKTVNKALGMTFDPSTVKTQTDLENLFEKIAAAGVPPVMIHGASWSMGAHYLDMAYALQSPDIATDAEFVDKMNRGQIDFSTNKIFNGLIDTFALLKKYNYRKDDPLVADYAKDCTDFAKGKVAFFFMGDWIWPQIKDIEGGDKDFGIIPVPISNNPDDYGNSQIPVSEPKLLAIDNSGSTSEQQTAAIEFLKWLITSEEGQTAIVEKMGLNLPYKDVGVKNGNVISDAVSQYVNAGKTISLAGMTAGQTTFPGDFYTTTGNSMLKYLAGKIDRTELVTEISDYWKSAANK